MYLSTNAMDEGVVAESRLCFATTASTGTIKAGCRRGEEWRKDAPVYLSKTSWPAFEGNSQVAEVLSIKASPEYRVMLTARREGSDR